MTSMSVISQHSSLVSLRRSHFESGRNGGAYSGNGKLVVRVVMGTVQKENIKYMI